MADYTSTVFCHAVYSVLRYDRLKEVICQAVTVSLSCHRWSACCGPCLDRSTDLYFGDTLLSFSKTQRL